jgi:hypothetical protein
VLLDKPWTWPFETPQATDLERIEGKNLESLKLAFCYAQFVQFSRLKLIIGEKNALLGIFIYLKNFNLSKSLFLLKISDVLINID